MARRYVRDKAGRFAPKGGGSRGKGGKMGKSAKNVKARAAYKNQSGKLREAKKMAGGKDLGDSKFWNRQLGGAKSGMTRVTNRLAGKGKGQAAGKAVGSGPKQKRGVKKKRGAKQYDNTTNQMFKQRKLKRDLKRKYPESKAVKRVEAKAKKKTAAKKKSLAKSKSYSGLTPKQQYKAARSKARAAKAGYAQDRGEGYDRAGKVSGKGKVKRSRKLPGSDDPRYTGAAKSQVTKLQKKFRKGVTQGKGYGLSKKGQKAKSKFKDLKRQRGGVTKGRGTIAQRKKSLNYRTTQQAFGGKVKKPVSKAAQKYIGKRNVEEMRIEASRGKGSKAKRRAAALAKKVPRTAKGAMAYDGPNKAASRARDRIVAKTKAKRKTAVDKELEAIRRKAKNIKFGEKKGPLTRGLSRGSSFFSYKLK